MVIATRAKIPARGRTSDPLYAARRVLHTGTDLLAAKQKDRLTTLFAVPSAEVEATWGIYQQMSPPTANPTAPTGASSCNT